MGYLIKLILFIIVFSWIFRAISRIFLGRLYRQAQQQQQFSKHQQRQHKRPADGNVNVDFSPAQKKPRKSSDDFKGGDYVDYEEVKD